MTRKLRVRDLKIRPANEDDRDALAGFTCSTGPWYEADVQRYVREHALRRALATPETYRLVVAFEDVRLVACGAHHHEALMSGDASFLLATRLQLLAIAVADQGAVLDDGTRLSDALLWALIADAMETRNGVSVMTAIVAQDNLRSMALCERNGLRSQVRYDDAHVRLTGRFTPR